MLRWIILVSAAALAAIPAHAQEEPFGQETTEVRAWRNPPKPGSSHQHGAHRHGHSHAHGHDHAHGHGEKPHSQHEHGAQGHEHGVETEHLFGFTVGSDVDEPGVRHFIAELDGRFTRRTGSYAAFSQRFEYASSPWRDFHVALGASFSGHDIAGVIGLDDRRQAAFEGFSLELRQRLLDRAQAPFGLTLVAEPHWKRADETSGAQVDSFATEFRIAADKELIKDKLYGALNLIYEPEWSRLKSAGDVERESTLGMSLAAMTALAPGMLAGGEVRYLRKYEGAALNTFTGEAIYLGPVLFINVSHTVSLIAAYSTQIAGRAAGTSGNLDLDHFERHLAKLKAAAHF